MHFPNFEFNLQFLPLVTSPKVGIVKIPLSKVVNLPYKGVGRKILRGEV